MKTLAQILYPLAAVFCLMPFVSSAAALVLGIVLALILGNPYLSFSKRWTAPLLQLSVVGLGAGMNLLVVSRVGLHGIGYTIVGIATTCLLGTILARLLCTPRDTGILITVGTAICGGSAIAAVAPVLRAKPHEVSVALGTVFMLNALALVIFPGIGHAVGLNETQFGLWSALAIHDTSSVVGATLQYGAHALEVGTTVKLARALWIVPVTLAVGAWRARQNDGEVQAPIRSKRPWFILGFLIMAAAVTWFPWLQEPGHYIELCAKRLLVLTLFLIGSGLTLTTLKTVGVKPFAQGVALWILVAASSLTAIEMGWIS